MAITAKIVKELREKTGAGMMDCKKALNETNGDMEQAVDWLRKKGISSASKKSSRIAAEGAVAAYDFANCIVALEVNSETDFVARNDKFQGFVTDLANHIANSNATDIHSLLSESFLDTDKTVDQYLTDLIATIGENISIRRFNKVAKADNSISAIYIHNKVNDNQGKIATIIQLSGCNDSELARGVAMHVAASKPLAINTESIDPALVEREKSIFIDQAKASGKPDNIIEKMVAGRIKKYYQQVVLLEQDYIMDTDNQVKHILGSGVSVANMVNFILGEGIEKKEDDFAQEVKRQVQG